MTKTPVRLYVYDLSNGLAKTMSRALTGTQIDGIWHTSVVAWGREVFYGQGISECRPGESHHGRPVEVVDCGETEIDEETFNEYIDSLRDHYTADAYHLLTFNCNSFTQDVISFLTSNSIPSHITNLPSEFLNTPFGQAMRPRIDAMFGAGSSSSTSSATAAVGSGGTMGMGMGGSAGVQAVQAGQGSDLASSLLRAVAQQATTSATSNGTSNGTGTANGQSISARASTSDISNQTNGISPTATTTSSLLICTSISSFRSMLSTHPCLIALFADSRPSSTSPETELDIEAVFTKLAETIGNRSGGRVAFVKIDIGEREGREIAEKYEVKEGEGLSSVVLFRDGKKHSEIPASSLPNALQDDPMTSTDPAQSNFQPPTSQNPSQPKSPNLTLKRSLHAHSKGVSSVKFSPDGRYLASGGAEGEIHLWDPETGNHLRALRGHTAGINDITFSSNSLYLASGSDDNTARIWSVEKGISLRTLTSHTSHVTCLAFNPKSNILATGGWDEIVILWDIKRGTQIKVLQAHSDPISSVGFNSDGTMLVTSSFDGLIRLWDAANGVCLKTIEDEQNTPLSFAAFTANGDYIISASLSSVIRIWNFHNSRCVKTFLGHKNVKYCSPVCIINQEVGMEVDVPSGIEGDNTNRAKDENETCLDGWVVSGTDEAQVVIWDLQSRQIVQRLEGHKDTVLAISVHPFKRMLATGSLERDRSIGIWTEAEGENKSSSTPLESATRELERKIDSFVEECFPPHPHKRLFLPATNLVPLQPILPSNKPNFPALTTKLQGFLPAPTKEVTEALKALKDTVISSVLGPTGDKMDVIQVAKIMEQWKSANEVLLSSLSPEQAFPVIDLLVFGLGNPNVSAWTTIGMQTGSGDDILSTVLGPAVALTEAGDQAGTKSTLLTTLRLLQICCKDSSLARATFGSGSAVAGKARQVFLHCQLHEDGGVRNAAAGLAMNIAAIRHRTRKEHEMKGIDAQGDQGGDVDEDWELEYLSAVVESVENAEDEDLLYRLVAALTLSLYLSPIYESQRSFLDVMEVKQKLTAKLTQEVGGKPLVSREEVKKLVSEVADKLCRGTSGMDMS